MLHQKRLFGLPPVPWRLKPAAHQAAKSHCIGCDSDDCPGPAAPHCADPPAQKPARRRPGKNKPEPTHEQEGF